MLTAVKSVEKTHPDLTFNPFTKSESNFCDGSSKIPIFFAQNSIRPTDSPPEFLIRVGTNI